MVLDLFKLDGKVAVVTGSGTGIGQSLAAALAQAGADVVCVVNSSEPTETRRMVEAAGRKSYVVKANLSDVKSASYVCEEAYKQAGKVDILLNNAGTIKRADALDFTVEDWDEVMNINLRTLFFLSQAFAKHWVKDSVRGKIINIASMLSYQGGIRVPSYTSSKSGLLGLTRLMANEWAKYGINANCIAPGYIETANTEQIRADADRNKSILDRIPAGRWGQPDDLNGAAVFLASRASDYVNGYSVAVDGGWLAR